MNNLNELKRDFELDILALLQKYGYDVKEVNTVSINVSGNGLPEIKLGYSVRDCRCLKPAEK